VNLRVNPQFAFGVILVAGYQFHSGHLSEFGSKLPNSSERICELHRDAYDRALDEAIDQRAMDADIVLH
jgi:hypothetical protein